jgi:hypothetical protein
LFRKVFSLTERVHRLPGDDASIFSVRCSSGELESTITLAAGSSGSLTARENGGPGDDTLVLLVQARGSHLKLLDALADGGGGTNSCLHTPNVQTLHISS